MPITKSYYKIPHTARTEVWGDNDSTPTIPKLFSKDRGDAHRLKSADWHGLDWISYWELLDTP